MITELYDDGFEEGFKQGQKEAIEKIKSKAHCDDVECWDCAFGDAEVGCLLKEAE